MIGVDISNWNTSSKMLGNDFVIIKASEGVNYKDEKLDDHYNYMINKTNIRNYGFYHYARPDLGNSGIDEAKSFLGYVGHHAGKSIFCLDWEGKALSYPISWIDDFLGYVEKNTGYTPFLYITESTENSSKMAPLADKYKLWIASWSSNVTIKNWKSWDIWQYESTDVDKNKTHPSAKWQDFLSNKTSNFEKEKILRGIKDIEDYVKRH